jgi:hypothetical protein
MLYFTILSRINFIQSVLVIALASDVRQRGVCYITGNEIIEFNLTLDIARSLSTTESLSTHRGVFLRQESSVVQTTSLLGDSTIVSPPASTTQASLSDLSTPSSSPSQYVFNSQSAENVAVYFGQTAATSSSSLAKQCANPNVDIAILVFVVSRNHSGGLSPGVNFGAACGGQTALMEEEAPALLSCPELATDINTCQTMYGKKVLLSIGGGGQSIIFNSASDATDLQISCGIYLDRRVMLRPI